MRASLPALSLGIRLTLLWVFTLVVCLALAALLNGVFGQGAGAQIKQSSALTEQACAELSKKFAWGVKNQSFEPRKEAQFQGALLEIILDHYSAVEGGFYSAQGFGPYAFPTYEGSGIKRDLPEAEKPYLASINDEALSKNSTVTKLRRGSREAQVVTACPVSAASIPSIAWVMTRVPVGASTAYDRFVTALAILLSFVAIMGIGISLLIYGWWKNLRKLETAILENQDTEIPLFHERDLDTIVRAFNHNVQKAKKSGEDRSALARKLAQADRLASLGQMAAGIAHEFRNPLASMRLKLENALANPADRMEKAAPVLMAQMERMDRLVKMILAATQPVHLEAKLVQLDSWLEEALTEPITVKNSVKEWSFDPFHLGRALENLVNNALSFSPSVEVFVTQEDSRLQIDVKDFGPGLTEETRARLFEPFSTERKGGTGLGLVLVKEICEAHGGWVIEIPSPQGAHFRMEIPWQKS
jgi:signal transduction histidine kinase